MKNYFDSFYEIIHKNSVKRRHMVSLLLVLSVFVSSGVLWELRDTVITMVNEPLCGLEQHEHTDECYEYRLVCGLEETEEHTHTDECWEKVLVCGYDEHMHTTLCFTDEDIPEADMAEADDDIFAISGTFDYIDDDAEDGILFADLPEVTLEDRMKALASEDAQNAPYINPGTETTIDNIAEGIKFTLFDYGDSTLESQNNHYGYRWVEPDGDTPGYWSHPNANTTDGINAGRNAQQDILFLAYGTPVNDQCHDPDCYNYRDEATGKKVVSYKPDKNSYSGDYNSDPVYSGNRPVSGIVDDKLYSYNEQSGTYVINQNGYPRVNASEHHSLAYLFNDEESAYKTVYPDVNHLLQRNDQNGHLFFNSNDNYAYYDKETGDFIVYDTTFPVINPDHHAYLDTDYHHLDENGEPNTYQDDKAKFMIGFFPFDEYDPTRRDPNFNGNGYNHHFGMKMETKFTNPTAENLPVYNNKKEPVSFKYSGDDDMWVFVDGKLVLDIGGIHEPTGGMIDFTNGLVWTQDNELGRTMDEVKSYLISVVGNGINNETDFDNLPKPIGTDTTGSGNKWIVESITEYIDDWYTYNPNGTHEIKMFYLERGGCYSNLAMEMNLPTLKPLTVKKEVDYQDHLVKDTDIDNKDYEFQVWEWIEDDPNTSEYDGHWTKPNLPQTTYGYFTLKDGERITFDDLEQHRKFRITEVGVDPNVYDKVSVNGVTMAQFTAGGANADVDSSANGVALSDTNSYLFNNRVIQDTTKIKVKKDWDCDDNKKPANFTMKYKIMRTDSATGEVKQVALKYDVTENGVTKTKKRRVFLLDPDEQVNGKTIENLLARYGNHVYTYAVEELNVPDGFKASYSDTYETDSESGKQYKVLQVTNTDITKTDIYVKKEWENIPPTGQPAVKLVLKREKVGYSPSQKTDLQVTILDEGGNLIRTEKFTNLYANGSAEIYYDMPLGVVLYKGDPAYPNKRVTVLTCTNADPGHEHTDTACYLNQNMAVALNQNTNKVNEPLYVKFEEDENILVVQNLAAKETGATVPANEVTFKVTSDNAEDSLLLLHHSFTKGTNGWSVQNDASKGTNAKVESSGYYPYAKGDSIRIYDRTKCFNGATLKLDPAKFKMNKTYTFSTYVYYDDTNNTNAPDSIQFNFTFNDGLNKENNGSYRGISSKTVQKGQWTQLTGTITLPESIDPYNMFIIVETKNPNNDSSASNYEAPLISQFYMDEFTAIEGNTQVEVEEDTGRVIVSGASVASNTEVYNITFGTTLPNDWSLHNRPNIGAGDNNLRIDGRGSDNDASIEKNVSSLLLPGHRYRFELGTQRDGPNGAGNVHISVAYNRNGQPEWSPWICTTQLSIQGDDQYKHYDTTGEFSVPADADMSNAILYFGTNNDTGPFRLRYLRIYDVTETTTSVSGNKDGYEIIGGKYYSDYSNYDLDLDENSVTNPLHLDGQYTVDKVNNADPNSADWSKEITLPIANGTLYDGMGYHWGKDILGEQTQTLYRYWIEEQWIDSDGNQVTTRIELNGDDKTVVSEHDDYIISYDRQFVSTNTEQSPILVKNKYIWYKLPATGGRGTVRIYFFGSVLTAIGILSVSALYRRRRRRV
ncbi:carbohydrate binding domain-containing protein [Ruminococcus sp.]|uniref:carbohydrate binding domain-containing protein n=1 Tax=Ruminococcus sp. TaxID=41978 RepID=UPI0025FBEB82|nr:carbohydrate binding domain-containing protein [Ruminococcus sp.]